jgi:hypothetical protein
MVLSPIYITFYWLQKCCIIIQMEKFEPFESSNILYQFIKHVPWNRYIKNLFPNIYMAQLSVFWSLNETGKLFFYHNFL